MVFSVFSVFPLSSSLPMLLFDVSITGKGFPKRLLRRTLLSPAAVFFSPELAALASESRARRGLSRLSSSSVVEGLGNGGGVTRAPLHLVSPSEEGALGTSLLSLCWELAVSVYSCFYSDHIKPRGKELGWLTTGALELPRKATSMLVSLFVHQCLLPKPRHLDLFLETLFIG